MATIIAIASGKGGVGKTLVTAALSLALQRRGHHVLAVDGDMGLRNLDLAFGLQDEVLYDAGDIVKENCKPDDAIIAIGHGLDFLAASQKKTWEKLNVPSYLYLVERLSQDYDYVLIDCPPGRGQAYKNAASLADKLFFVVEPTWSSLRDTDRLMRFCDKHKIFEYAILFNNFYQECSNYVSIHDAVQILDPEHIGGLLPHDEEINGASQNSGLCDISPTNPFMVAMDRTVSYLTEDADLDMEFLCQLLPAGFDGNRRNPGKWQERLSLHQRRAQISSWRRKSR